MKGGSDSKNFSKLLDLEPTEISDPEFENQDPLFENRTI